MHPTVERLIALLRDFTMMAEHPKERDYRAEQAARGQWRATVREARALLDSLLPDDLTLEDVAEQQKVAEVLMGKAEADELRACLQRLYGVSYHRNGCDKGIPEDEETGEMAATCACGMRQALDWARRLIHPEIVPLSTERKMRIKANLDE